MACLFVLASLIGCAKNASESGMLRIDIKPSAATFKVDMEQFKEIPRELIDFCFLQQIKFVVTVRNLTDKEVTFSLHDVANISISKFSKDGVALTPLSSVGEMRVSPRTAREAALKTLKPGESAMFSFAGLCPIRYVDGEPVSRTTYSFPGTGAYKVVFQYQYLGGDRGKPNVFRGPWTSDEIVFTLE